MNENPSCSNKLMELDRRSKVLSRTERIVELARHSKVPSTESIAPASEKNVDNLALISPSTAIEVHATPCPPVHAQDDINLIASTEVGQQCGADNVYAESFFNEYPTRMRLTKVDEISYRVSPVHSNESDCDDSDADPSFNVTKDSSSSSSSDSAEELVENEAEVDEQEKKGKKRKRNPEKWQMKKVKLLRNSGKAYSSLSKSKKQFSAREIGPSCGEKCRLRCSTKIDDEIRRDIFSNYWKLADLQLQREFIVRNTLTIKPKYRYSSTQNFRNMNSAFHFEVKGNRIRVCKQFFKATLGINDRPIRTALAKKNDTGFLDADLRGKHGKQPTAAPEVKDSVRRFINSIPRIESHYLRAQSSCEYIEGGRSLADIYRDYKEKQERQELPFAHSVMFNRIFNNEFKISFYCPKKDQCDQCETYKNADDEGRQKLADTYNLHIKEKELCRKEKECDKNKQDGTFIAVYDLQAVMPLPKGLVSSFYYSSKLNCYNFTVSDLHAKNVECYFWNETEGKRGAVEIGSCVLDYVKILVENANKPAIDIIFYSDNCCGQQKNKYLLAAYAYAVQNFNVRSIEHKFLICGHTQNEGDNVHSVIEKQVKRHLKASPVYTPDQYSTLIRSAKKNGPPYQVHELTYENFYDLKALQEQWGTNFSLDIDREKFKWNDIKVLRVENEHPRAFFYKTSYEDVEFKKVMVKKTRNTIEAFNVDLVPAYEKMFPLTDVKKTALKSLCQKTIIPKKYYEQFYKNIFELQ